MASTGHSGSHNVQSIHSSGSMTRKFGPSRKQSTGQTSTQSMYLHLMQLSVTTKVIGAPGRYLRSSGAPRGRLLCQRSMGAKSLRSTRQRTFDVTEVQRLDPGPAIFEIAAQREGYAGEGDGIPWYLIFVVQITFEALGAHAVVAADQGGTKVHMHLSGVQQVTDGQQ